MGLRRGPRWPNTETILDKDVMVEREPWLLMKSEIDETYRRRKPSTRSESVLEALEELKHFAKEDALQRVGTVPWALLRL